MARRDDLSSPRGAPGGPVYDPEAFGVLAERLARFFGTPRYIVGQTVLVVIWIAVNVAAVTLRFGPDEDLGLSAEEWAEVLIASQVTLERAVDETDVVADADLAPGEKCARCWRILREVGSVPHHPSLCLRCADAVDSGLVLREAAE